MYNEQIHEAWWNYLNSMFKFSTSDIPDLFQHPRCGTCSHWFLINENDLHNLSATLFPYEYDEIINDLRDHYFYGWCKRFPRIKRSGYSFLVFRSLFTFLSRNKHQKAAEYDFPLMPHACSCEEWKENKWVADFVNENKKLAQPDA